MPRGQLATITHRKGPNAPTGTSEGGNLGLPGLHGVHVGDGIGIWRSRNCHGIEEPACGKLVFLPRCREPERLEGHAAGCDGGGYAGGGLELLVKYLELAALHLGGGDRLALAQMPGVDARLLDGATGLPLVGDRSEIRRIDGGVVAQSNAVVAFAVNPIVGHPGFGAEPAQELQVGFPVLGAVHPDGLRQYELLGVPTDWCIQGGQQLSQDLVCRLVLESPGTFHQTKLGVPRSEHHGIVVENLIAIILPELPDQAVVDTACSTRQRHNRVGELAEQLGKINRGTQCRDQAHRERESIPHGLPAHQTGRQKRVFWQRRENLQGRILLGETGHGRLPER